MRGNKLGGKHTKQKCLRTAVIHKPQCLRRVAFQNTEMRNKEIYSRAAEDNVSVNGLHFFLFFIASVGEIKNHNF